jgi:putative transposase
LHSVADLWSSDITYLPMRHGFIYLTGVIDRYSRYVLSWRLSNTLDGRFCLEALNEAMATSRPEIFNTDQGSQFTAHEYNSRPEEAAIAVSRDGRGRALDNVFLARLWRSVKYEEIYIKGYERAAELESGLTAYFRFCEEARPHQCLAIGLRLRSIEPDLAEAESGRPVTNPAQPSGPVGRVEPPVAGTQAMSSGAARRMR